MTLRCATIFLGLASLTLGGCAFMSDEDRDFYGKGWVKPGDLDKEAPVHRKVIDPSHPEYDESNAPAPAPVAKATPPEFLVPETSENPNGNH